MRHLAALVCAVAFLATACFANLSLQAQNSFPNNTNPQFNGNTNSTHGGFSNSGFNANSSGQNSATEAPEIFTIEITEEQLRDLRNGYKLETVFPERIRQSVKKIQLKLVPGEAQDRTAGLPNSGLPNTGSTGGTIHSTTDPNLNQRSPLPPFRSGNTGSGLPPQNSGSSFGTQNNNPQSNNSQWGSPVATRQYDTQAGPPIPQNVNDLFNRSNSQPINTNQPPRFQPRNPPNNSGFDTNPTFVPQNNRGQMPPNQMRPSTNQSNEFDTARNNPHQPFNNRGLNPNPDSQITQNQFARNTFPRNNDDLRAPEFNQPSPQRPLGQSGGFRPDQTVTNGNGYPDNRMANNTNPSWQQDRYRGLQDSQNNQSNQYPPKPYNPGNSLPDSHISNPNMQGSRGSLVGGQHVPIVQNQVPQVASRIGYNMRNQVVPNDNGMQARIRGNEPNNHEDGETVGANRGPNGETRPPVAQLNRINQVLFFFLLCSIGLNLYLGWISRGFYVRYRELADELRDTFATA